MAAGRAGSTKAPEPASLIHPHAGSLRDLRSIRKRIDEIESEAAENVGRQMPFPGWIDRVRAAPNALLRSALFGVVKPGRRKYVKEMPLPMVGDLALTYTGELLDQADFDIFLQIVHYARQRRAEDFVIFSTRRLLREIGRSTGKSDYTWLRSRLDSLSACGIVITNGRGKRVFSGPILLGAQDDTTDQSAFKLNPFIRGLFEDFTEINWDGRLSLGAKQLAKWLLALYSSHADPYPMKVQTLMTLCRSQAKDIKHFRADLRRMLTELHQRGLLRAWRIDQRDLVHVQTIPSPSQARHLARKGHGIAPTIPRDSSDGISG